MKLPEPAVLRALSAQVEGTPRHGWVWCSWCGQREERAPGTKCEFGAERRRPGPTPVCRGPIQLTEKGRQA